MTHIDLFTGIGGFALAAQWVGFKTVAFVEIEPYAQAIIRQNFGAVADTEGERESAITGSPCKGVLQLARDCRIYGDIRTFDGTAYRGATLLTGGFPCQPFSQAGKRRGAADDRAIWPEMFRVICEARPAWVIGENVAGIVTMELDRVLSDLEGEGYAVQPLIIPACAVDAKHRRDRVWIVGHAEDGRLRRGETSGSGGQPAQSSEDVADTARHEQGWQEQRAIGEQVGLCGESHGMDAGRALLQGRRAQESAQWLPEPDVGRVAHGVPRRVDHLKGLGNAIVPQVAYEIIKGIAEIERERSDKE